MNFSDTLRKLYGLRRFGMRLGLESMIGVAEALGNPEREFRTVHLAGTNGKGSTAAMLASCLERAGYRVGLFTSPHLCRFSERIRVNQQEIDSESLSRLSDLVMRLQPGLTFFEVATAMAFVYFAEMQVDWAIVETGLGGRLDATNIINPDICVLTSIGMDHNDVLGSSLAEIAVEKAGIIKQEVPVVCAPGTRAVIEVIEKRSRETNSKLRILGRDFKVAGNNDCFSYSGTKWDLNGLVSPLLGAHQRENAGLCIAALEKLDQAGLGLAQEDVRKGLLQAKWPGRMEWVGEFLLDCAHNPSGAQVLASAISEAVNSQQNRFERGADFSLIFGILKGKDSEQTLAPLRSFATRIVFTRPNNDRAMPPEELADKFGGEVAKNLVQALEMTKGDPRLKVITGSSYLVGEARAELLGEPVDPIMISDPI
ncbi:MAG: folylpolyglutamate synthase/dihydrofolate synthase family protein [Pseudomonadota bacterium]